MRLPGPPSFLLLVCWSILPRLRLVSDISPRLTCLRILTYLQLSFQSCHKMNQVLQLWPCYPRCHDLGWWRLSVALWEIWCWQIHSWLTSQTSLTFCSRANLKAFGVLNILPLIRLGSMRCKASTTSLRDQSLLKMLSPMPFFIMQVAVSTTIRFSLIFFFCFQRSTKSCYRSTLIRSYMSFSMSMAFIRSKYLGQIAKPVSFWYWESPKKVLLVLLLAMFAVLLGVMVA